ncbi:MAG: YARHG domain-containing protein [Eubacteriales bacterium]|nr:YARHG domain-containing protein [Eubacteriales bacterium]
MEKIRKLLKVFMFTLITVSAGSIFSEYVYAESDDAAYIIPDSDSRYLTESELTDMSLQVLNYAKNEIYAREGRIFRSKELQTYFEQQSWYQGTIQPDDFDDMTMLNPYEYANTQLVSEVEHSVKADGYKVDQPGCSYEPIYQYIAARNTESTETTETLAVISAEDYNFIGGKDVQSVSFEEQYTNTETGLQYIYGEIKGIDSEGKTVWERKTNQYICAGCAAVCDIGEYDKFYYYVEGGKVVKLDKAKGEIQWETDAGVAVPTTVFGADGTLYFACSFSEAPDFTAISEDGKILDQIDNITGDYSEVTDIRYLGNQVAVTCYEDSGDTFYLIDLDDFSYHKREYQEKLDWYGGIYDFTEYEAETGAKVVRYVDEDIDGDEVTELLTCSKDKNGKERYFIWKKDQDEPMELFSFTGEQQEAPVKALYYNTEKGMLVVYNEQDSMQTFSFYSIEDAEVRLNYCVYQKKEGMKWGLYLYQAYSEFVGEETDRRIKMLEYGMENDESKKAAGIVWKGYIDKLSKFEFKKP